MSQHPSQRTAIELLPCPRYDLPAAEMRYTVDCAASGSRVVSCAYLAPAVEAQGKVRSVEFDDGKVVVDLDERDQVVGFEVLSYTDGPMDLPQLMAFILEHDDFFLWACILTVMQYWVEIRSYVEAKDAWKTILGGLEDRYWRAHRSAGGEGSRSVPNRVAKETVWA